MPSSYGRANVHWSLRLRLPSRLHRHPTRPSMSECLCRRFWILYLVVWQEIQVRFQKGAESDRERSSCTAVDPREDIIHRRLSRAPLSSRPPGPHQHWTTRCFDRQHREGHATLSTEYYSDTRYLQIRLCSSRSMTHLVDDLQPPGVHGVRSWTDWKSYWVLSFCLNIWGPACEVSPSSGDRRLNTHTTRWANESSYEGQFPTFCSFSHSRLISRRSSIFSLFAANPVSTIDSTPDPIAGVKSATILIDALFAHGRLSAETGVQRLCPILAVQPVRLTAYLICVRPGLAALSRRRRSLWNRGHQGRPKGPCHYYHAISGCWWTAREQDGECGPDRARSDGDHVDGMLPVDCQQDPWLTRRKVPGRPFPASEQIAGIGLASLTAVRGEAGRDVCVSRLLRRLLISYVRRARSRQAAHVSLPSVAFGSQVRSYTLQPEARVKDARTGVDVVGSAAVHAVLDGDIDRRGLYLV
jgi:hypothetical protein